MKKEKDTERLTQINRIEYKLDKLIMEDTFNYIEYIKYFTIIIFIGGWFVTKYVGFIILCVLSYIIFLTLALTFRFWKSYENNKKYFKTIPKIKSLKNKS